MTTFTIHKLDATTSTNEVLKNAVANEQLKAPTLLWAEYQFEGKGQLTKSWQSNAGQNLTFSVFWPEIKLSSIAHFRINILVCLALIEVFEFYQIPDLRIKWPNDILSDRSKVAGILIENLIKGQNIQSTVVGVGININQLDFEGLPQAGSFALSTGKQFDREEILHTVQLRLYKAFKCLHKKDSIRELERFNKLIFGRGHWCKFLYKGIEQMGKIVGLDTLGSLQIEWENELVESFNDTAQIKMLY